MQSVRMRRDVRPGDLRTSTPFSLNFLVPLFPLTYTRQRDESGQVFVPALRFRDERRRLSLDVELRADDRKHGGLARRAAIVGVSLGVRAHRILERRHRFDRELRDPAQIRGIGDSEMAIPLRACVLRQRFGRDGAVGEGKARMRAKFDVLGGNARLQNDTSSVYVALSCFASK